MSTDRIANFVSFHRKDKLFLLAFFSFCGTFLGTLTSYHLDSFILALMRRGSLASVSIVGLIVVNFLPFLITSVVILLSKPSLFLPIGFLKNFSFAFFRSLICISYGQAGWLVGTIMLFSDTIVMVLLHWFWIRHIDGIQVSAYRDLSFCFAVSFVACILDYIWVSPFLMQLLID